MTPVNGQRYLKLRSMNPRPPHPNLQTLVSTIPMQQEATRLEAVSVVKSARKKVMSLLWSRGCESLV